MFVNMLEGKRGLLENVLIFLITRVCRKINIKNQYFFCIKCNAEMSVKTLSPPRTFSSTEKHVYIINYYGKGKRSQVLRLKGVYRIIQ